MEWNMSENEKMERKMSENEKMERKMSEKEKMAWKLKENEKMNVLWWWWRRCEMTRPVTNARNTRETSERRKGKTNRSGNVKHRTSEVLWGVWNGRG
ncbi:hypothetical protein Pcinc_003248 [Petrolisthes cinctipes]|uniref:Uncharacterized protein n=1 Tax=Petrolisthes cinctipes TaxID=88211 RepID=A0AAE1GNX9_PETCI|nr:hypothetical protein Pcinc_003248 [Petrolisthes cinctipes]